MTKVKLALLCVLFSLALAPARAEQRAAGPEYLAQGWTAAERETFYYTPQGSEVLPYAWFLALEQPWSERPFREDAYLASFNYLPERKSASNPDGLPVGFVRGKTRAGEEWFGLSCAACHTGQLTYQGRTLRVDGGTTLADVLGFQTALVMALRATLAYPPKLARFARRVLGGRADAANLRALEEKMRGVLFEMGAWEASSRPVQRHGFGTWDAINILMNTINATALSEPSNNRTPEVPVSYPSIWLTMSSDWLLWNASIQNATVRAVGEVIIVFGRAKVTAGAGGLSFSTSADVRALNGMYQALKKLTPPKWPQDLLGRIDQAKAGAGHQLYLREGCVKCHHDQPPYPMTPKDAAGNQYIQIAHTPLAQVGTDPTYARYFVGRTAVPALMAPAFRGTAIEGQPVIPAALLFLATLTGITVAEVDRVARSDPERQELLGNRPVPSLPKTKAELDALVSGLLAYKAGPLAGVWSTAPYLHNGSVPTLHDLLLPPERRPRTFTLGRQEFDPVNVGYRTEGGGFTYDVSVRGQSNAGHLWGTTLNEDERQSLLEYLKTL